MKESKWKFDWVSLADIVPARLNANRMTDDDFNALVRNIEKTGGLSSAITCYKRSEDGKFVLISGEHRYKALLKGGYDKAPCIYTDENNLSRDEIIALQTSHNSLHGSDDKSILKRLFDEIQSIEFKEIAHINIDEIGSFDAFSTSVVPVSEHYSVNLTLYKNDLDTLDDLIGCIKENVSKSEVIILANQDNTEEMLMELNREIKQKYNIVSGSVAFAKILELAKKQMENDTDNND